MRRVFALLAFGSWEGEHDLEAQCSQENVPSVGISDPVGQFVLIRPRAGGSVRNPLAHAWATFWYRENGEREVDLH